MDDRTVGLVLRSLRRRLGWRQTDLAARAGCSQASVSVIERGHLGGVTIATLRAMFGAVDARLQLAPSWRGAELDRLVDAEHASIVDHLAGRLERAGFDTALEVTYAIRGERGSIDVLGLRPDVRAAVVCEVKSEVGAAEATGRKLDEKRRLVAAIVRDRFGWTPDVVGAVLVFPESSRLRRLLTGPAAALGRMFPVDSRRVVAWLRMPSGPLAATWFLSDIAGRSCRRVTKARRARCRAQPQARSDQSGGRPSVVNTNPGVNSSDDEPPSRILR